MNNNITEDYCSFEVSKLLKEKGFDSDVTREVYKSDGSDRFSLVTNKYIDDTAHFNGVCLKPTHALAIKWIRENFKIEVEATCIRFNSPRKKGYQFIVISNDYFKFEQLGDFNSPEEATEAALLYTLKNLIQMIYT
jgi:hypothetical protein